MTITDLAIARIKGNYSAIAGLMESFNRGQKSIENWLDAKDVRLTTPQAINVIKSKTGLSESEIIEPTKATP